MNFDELKGIYEKKFLLFLLLHPKISFGNY